MRNENILADLEQDRQDLAKGFEATRRELEQLGAESGSADSGGPDSGGREADATQGNGTDGGGADHEGAESGDLTSPANSDKPAA